MSAFRPKYCHVQLLPVNVTWKDILTEITFVDTKWFSDKTEGMCIKFQSAKYWCLIHCERKVIQHLEEPHHHEDNVKTARAFKYLGVSKLSCSSHQAFFTGQRGMSGAANPSPRNIISNAMTDPSQEPRPNTTPLNELV